MSYYLDDEDEDGESIIYDGPLYSQFVKVEHIPGVAFYVSAYITSGPNDGMVECYMVGDDKKHILCPLNMTVIDTADFCHSCGQIGCAWH